MLYILLVAVGLLAVTWVAAFLYVQDFSVPTRKVPAFQHLLVIFPHADDETNVAGLVWLLGKRGTKVTFVVLTQGENGTPDAHRDSQLPAKRAAEMLQVCTQLCHGSLIQANFGDGQLAARWLDLTDYIDKLLDKEQPDLVITYDLAGMYGHEDHIVCTEIITKLVKAKHAGSRLWYVAFTQPLTRHLHLPAHMAKDPGFMARRAQPNAKFFVGLGTLAKIRSVYGHRSQRKSFRSMMPWLLPIWFVYSLQAFEYYEDVSR